MGPRRSKRGMSVRKMSAVWTPVAIRYAKRERVIIRFFGGTFTSITR